MRNFPMTRNPSPVRWLAGAALALAPLAAADAQQQFFDALSRTCTGTALSTLNARSCQTCHTSAPGQESGSSATTATAVAYRSGGAAAACATLAPAVPVNSSAPSLTLVPPGSQRSVRLGETVTITARASDRDGSAVVLAATGLPADASFDAGSGVFRWTPAAAATATVVFTATDRPSGGIASKSTSQEVRIAVEQNRPPVLGGLRSPVTVKAGKTFRLPLSATDPDTRDKVKFSFGLDETGASSQPPGARIQNRPKSNPRKFNALFLWKPAADLAGKTYAVRFLATDNGRTPLQDDAVVELRVVP